MALAQVRPEYFVPPGTHRWQVLLRPFGSVADALAASASREGAALAAAPPRGAPFVPLGWVTRLSLRARPLWDRDALLLLLVLLLALGAAHVGLAQ